MSLRFRRLPAVSLPVILLGAVILAACGGGSATGGESTGDRSTTTVLSLEDYVSAVEASNDRADEQLSALDPIIDSALEEMESLDLDEALAHMKDALRNMFSASGDIFREFVESMQSLRAPEELAAEHDAYMQAIEALVVLWDGFAVVIPSSESLEDIGVLMERLEESSSPLMTDLEWACTRLQAAAGTNGVSAEFSCD